MGNTTRDPMKILLITTADCSYPAANLLGQMHLGYSANTYIIRVPDPVMLPEVFYLHALKRGFDGIVVMSSGAECPFEGTYVKLSRRLDELSKRLKALDIDHRRVQLCAICSVCTASFLRELKKMNDLLAEIGPFDPSSIPEEITRLRRDQPGNEEALQE